MATDLTAECVQGFRAAGAACPFYHSSDSWLAWRAGEALWQRGATAPTRCRKSRGYSVRLETAANAYTFKAVGAALDAFDLDRHG